MSDMSRRQWLTGVTALAATAMAPARRTGAQAATGRPHRIDVHHHYSGSWTPEVAIEGMDRAGIATAIVSRPGIPVSEVEKGRKLARDNNEAGANLVHERPARFGFFATLPLWDTEGSLREIAYAFDTLKADGACLVTSYGNPSYGTKWIGNAAFTPVFDELNRRKAVVFVYPTTPYYYNDDYTLVKGSTHGEPGLNDTGVENQFDTARAIMSLVVNGVLMRCPDIRFIFCHGGGAMPTLHERMNHRLGEDRSYRHDGSYHSKFVPNGFDRELAKVYLDCVRVANPANFAMLLKLMPPEHLLFGTDFQSVEITETANNLRTLGLAAKILDGIERDNAVALFPRLKA